MIWRSPLALAAGATAAGAAATGLSPPPARAVDALHPASAPSPSTAHATALAALPRAGRLIADRGAAVVADAAARAPRGASVASARGAARAPRGASAASVPGFEARARAPPASSTPTGPGAAGSGQAAP